MFPTKVRASIIAAIAVAAVTAISVPSVASAREVFASPTAKGSSEEVCHWWEETIEEIEKAPGSSKDDVAKAEQEALEAGCIVVDPQKRLPASYPLQTTSQDRLSSTTLANG